MQEDRLDGLREEARRTGRVADAGIAGIPVRGGPIPRDAASLPGYYGQPIVKPPVWTWQVGLYLFIGGMSGMSGVIALASLVSGQSFELVRAALGVTVTGAVLSPLLLIWDLGRPSRFLNMLRVFKWRSAMSMGVWTLVLFGNFATAAFVLAAFTDSPIQWGVPLAVLRALVYALVIGTALSGVILATYTGVLLGATAVPIWAANRTLLPFHFGSVGLGSAVAVLELLGFRLAVLSAIALTVAVVETGIGIWLEMPRKGAAGRGIHHGTSGLLLRAAALMTGLVPLVARLAGWVPFAGISFLFGAVCSRYGWVLAGRSSAQHTPAACSLAGAVEIEQGG